MIQEIQETNDVATAEQSGLASADCSGRQRLSHYALFKHMADVHELTLIDDELEQIALSVKDGQIVLETLVVEALFPRTERMNMPDPMPQTNTTAPTQALSQSALLEDFLQCMVDMHDNATDTYWVNDGETLWERMASIYEKHGGDMETIKAKFPLYF